MSEGLVLITLFYTYREAREAFLATAEQASKNSENYEINLFSCTIDHYGLLPRKHLFLLNDSQRLIGLSRKCIVTNPWMLSDRLKAKFIN